MGKKKNKTENGNLDHNLKGEAEERLAQFPGAPDGMQEKTLEEVIHELQIYQIELEMQNEELRKAQLTLEESRERYADLYDFAPVGYFTFTPEALINEANLTGAALLGMTRQKLINARFRRMVETKEQDRWDRYFLSVLQRGGRQGCDLTLKRSDGATFQAQLESIRKELKTGPPLVLTAISDISESKRMQEALQEREQRFRELSMTDDLTQLSNQRHFYQQLQQEIERTNRYQHQLAMLLLDLDDFKHFNDTYGHLEGDKVLVKAANILQECIRKTDTAFRFGGEEFLVIMPETSAKRALILAERIRNKIQNVVFNPAPKAEVQVTCSIGLSQYQNQEDLKGIIKRVDQNMYQAKAKGKNQSYFS